MNVKYYNPNPEGRNVGDCTVRALCRAMDKEWEPVYTALCLQGYQMRDMPSSNAVQGVRYDMAAQACDTRNTIQTATRDILENNNSNTRAILDFLTQDKISTLTAENQSLKLAASQSSQNAVLMAAMDANKAEILRRTGAECPTPAYVVQPPQPVTFPNFCNSGCGCGNGCGC